MKVKNWILLGFISVIMIALTQSNTVYAGDINAAESRVISAASGTFEYDGGTYRAYAEYLAELEAYMMRDDKDLSDAEADDLIYNMNSSIEAGVRNGYLYLVSGKPSKKIQKSNDADEDAETKINKIKKKYDIEKSIENNKIFYQSEDSKDTLEIDMVVKNTGYNISRMMYVGVALLMLTVVTLCAATKLMVFAPEDES